MTSRPAPTATSADQSTTPVSPVIVLAGLTLFLCVTVVISPWFGSQKIDLSAGFHGWWAHLWGDSGYSPDARIFEWRLMRTALALLAGGGLAIVGAAFQAILRNPLVEPSTLGVSSAAAVGALVATVWDWTLPGLSAVQVAAFVAALADILLIYTLARLAGRLSMSSLLLSGITLSFMCGAAILVLIHVSDPFHIQVYEIWLLGTVEVEHWQPVGICLALVSVGALVLLWQSHNLNPIALGDDFARGRGVAVERTQALIFIFGSLVTAGVVSVAGPIAFVGLIVPHVVRRLLGADQRFVLIGSLICGAGFLIACDETVRFGSSLLNEWLHTRDKGSYTELPVGVLTALIGGPVFLWVLIRAQKSSPV